MGCNAVTKDQKKTTTVAKAVLLFIRLFVWWFVCLQGREISFHLSAMLAGNVRGEQIKAKFVGTEEPT